MKPIRIEEPHLTIAISPNTLLPFKGAKPYMTPRRFHFKNYHTQDVLHTLFRAMRNCIRSHSFQSIESLGCEDAWAVGSGNEFVFITDSRYAKKAQEILIKHQPKHNSRYFDYYRDCKVLEKIVL